MKLLRLALIFLGLLAVPFIALAQVGPGAPQANLYCESSAGPPPVWQPCSTGNPLAVNASVTVGSVQVTIGSAQNLQWQNGVSLGTPVTWGSTPSGVVISANVNCVAGCSASSGTSPVNLAQVNGATVLVGAGTPQTNSPRIVVAQDSTTVGGSASIPAGTNTIGTANVVNLAGTATIGTANVTVLSGTATIGSVQVSNTNANGQATMANSSPVVIASNQSSVAVTATGSPTAQPLVVTGTAGMTALFVNDEGTFYPNNANFIGGSASTTGTAQFTVTGTPTAGDRYYVPTVQCGRTDAGTTALYVTFNDKYSTVIVIPNNGGGGGNNVTFSSPLVGTPTATPLKATFSAAVSTGYCSAQGYQAP